MKKTIYLAALLIAMVSINACGPAYVSIEPAYVEYERPMRPSVNHIWIEGDWLWSYQTRTYKQGRGRWEQSRNGRTYQQGHWKQGPRGKVWQKGRWN
ncbi:MAG: hypothetical protein B7Y15_11450 [Bacteroidetes bacterium 24-39-8]|nr:MAG: hypothetical protein B7Y15_11450 [Bacteroidetes bacterium 24-39-8]OZA68983.1 MAG: hypothetical protein B7X72_00930 [Sphingobacteriia bacterium 39-39-8]HQR94109.1 hypothetical protein [Sediminibacterium sp.]HQS56154.1 hypothetical protein [Sediminibacterium sp.]